MADTKLMTTLETWNMVYQQQLKWAVTDFPSEYAYSVDQVPMVAARMAKAFEAGTYNKDSRAIKQTCKSLGIKHTYRAINEYLKWEVQA